MRKSSLIVSVLVFVSIFFVGMGYLPQARATTLYVGGAGPDNYTTVQGAIEDAFPGDSIYVYEGTYQENVIINKTVSLIGENKDATIIDANGTGDVVRISANWVNVTGFTTTGGGNAGVELDFVENCNVSGNNMIGNYYGIYLRYSMWNSISYNNASLSPWGRGIYLDHSNLNTISGNNIMENPRGVYLDDSQDNTILGNTITSNSMEGIAIISSDGNNVTDNAISESGTGVQIQSSQNTDITSNTIWNNSYGIWLTDLENTTVDNNTISMNDWMGVYHQFSAISTFANNVMVENGIFMSGTLRYWNTHTIDTSNTVNGNPVYYWKDLTGGAIPPGAGQIILANCSGVVVENQTISDATAGIQVGYSTSNIIANNTLNRNSVLGIGLTESIRNIISINKASWSLAGISSSGSENTIVQNVVSDNSYGISIGGSSTTVDSNVISDNDHGIHMYGCSNITVRSNWVSRNGHGIHVNHTVNSTFDTNIVTRSQDFGFYLELTENITITSNEMTRNFGSGVRQRFSNYNILHLNNISGNLKDGISAYYAANLTIRNNDIMENLRGIYLHISSYLLIAENRLLSNYDAGVYIQRLHRGSILNNTIESNEVYGIAAMYVSGSTIRGNKALGNPGGIVLAFPTDSLLANNTISECEETGITLYSGSGNIVVNNTVTMTQSGITVLASNNTTVASNKVAWAYLYGGIIFDSSDFNVATGNNLTGNWIGVYLVSSNGNAIFGNTATQHNIYGIYLLSSNENAVAGNTATGNHYGVYLNCSSRNTVADNRLSSNYDAGLFSDSSSRNTIVNNTIYYNGDLLPWIWKPSGAHFDSSYHNTVSGNTIFGNLWAGLSLYFSGQNTIVNNEVSVNYNDGIYMSNCTNNTIEGNDISFNGHTRGGFGINLSFSRSNRIFHNRIEFNRRQAHDDNDTNQWDDGYPSGGNYWSDYSGPDLYRGPAQDIPGGDGIGEEPYLIDTSGIDRYPLLSQGVFDPVPGENVRAILSGNKFENVTIVWDPSPHEPFGLVERYEVYRGENYEIRGRFYQHIGGVPNGTHSFVDSLAGEENPNTYFYVVCVVSVTNNSACAKSQAGKFTRPLTPGPNLASIPLIQSNKSIETVLQTVKFDKTWFYNSSSEEWIWFMKSKHYRKGLYNFSHATGLWINVTEYSNLTVAGMVPAQTTIQLHKGWNLVSFPSFNASYTVADLKASVPVERVEAFDSSAPPHFLRVLVDSDVLSAGQGYWVKASEDATWVVSNA